MSETISFTAIHKALSSLERALQQEKNEFTRDAAIQRFEYSYELTWKLLKRCLKEFYGIDEGNIKNLYRHAYKNKLIENIDAWFDYHSARNLTSHTYNEDTAEETYSYTQQFLANAKSLVKALEGIVNAA